MSAASKAKNYLFRFFEDSGFKPRSVKVCCMFV